MMRRRVRWGCLSLVATAMVVWGCGRGSNQVEKPDKYTPPPTDAQRVTPGQPPPPKTLPKG